jgi:dienelactone hydrolase
MTLDASMFCRAAVMAAAAFFAASVPVWAEQAGPQNQAEGPLRKQEWRIPVPDADGSTERLLEALLYRPAGEGRRPLVIISHGSPRRVQDRAGMQPDWAERAAEFFVAQGFAVLAPMRRGYRRSPGDADDLAKGPCSNPDYTDAGMRVGRQIAAIARYMQRQGFVEANRIVLAGQSAGGFASLAAARENPEGVIAVINFAGGRGSRADNDVCGEAKLVEAMGHFGQGTRVPSIWLYSENDLFFRPELARRMHASYALGGARTTLHILGAYGADGHGFLRRADSAKEWQPLVQQFMATLVFAAPPPRSGTTSVPPPAPRRTQRHPTEERPQ